MKYRDKDGNVFEDMEAALDEAFHCNCCSGWDDCPLGQQAAMQSPSCMRFCTDHPAEAARLMGYEVVEEEPGIANNVNIMDDFEWFSDDFPQGKSVEYDISRWTAKKETIVVKVNDLYDEDGGDILSEKKANMDKQKPRMTNEEIIRTAQRILYDSDKNGQFTAEDLTVLSAAIGIARILERQSRTEEKEESMKQDRPLSEWTLGEVKEYCSSRDGRCDDCIFNERTCMVSNNDCPHG